MNRTVFLALAALLLVGTHAAGADVRMQGKPLAPGTVQGRAPLPPASQAVPRGARTFARCNAEALKRRLRGAERRHFVQRCRLGYGQRLFRRRTVRPDAI
ncbi:hypothetical protein [uncultured Enterovirga sp.]|uniref:hypothetical protein n=1 Tax=uncultured Enterovirga sp. TaxID=2026352 RepID=UPI0035CB37F2